MDHGPRHRGEQDVFAVPVPEAHDEAENAPHRLGPHEIVALLQPITWIRSIPHKPLVQHRGVPLQELANKAVVALRALQVFHHALPLQLADTPLGPEVPDDGAHALGVGHPFHQAVLLLQNRDTVGLHLQIPSTGLVVHLEHLADQRPNLHHPGVLPQIPLVLGLAQEVIEPPVAASYTQALRLLLGFQHFQLIIKFAQHNLRRKWPMTPSQPRRRNQVPSGRQHHLLLQPGIGLQVEELRAELVQRQPDLTVLGHCGAEVMQPLEQFAVDLQAVELLFVDLGTDPSIGGLALRALGLLQLHDVPGRLRHVLVQQLRQDILEHGMDLLEHRRHAAGDDLLDGGIPHPQRQP
mmetsp:Transcript_49537/g.130575  ORF Transcript_49537/g.130575 Transcript_49537/m.130575 type:complete len:351 (-) Transcript_49537:1895-2947(-)